MADVNSQKKYACKQCQASFNGASNLRRHVNGKHAGKRYDCAKCEKSFSRSDNLKKHINQEHGEAAVVDSPAPVLQVRSVVVVPGKQSGPATKARRLAAPVKDNPRKRQWCQTRPPPRTSSPSAAGGFRRPPLTNGQPDARHHENLNPPLKARGKKECWVQENEAIRRQMAGKDRCISRQKEMIASLKADLDRAHRDLKLKVDETGNQTTRLASLEATVGQILAQQRQQPPTLTDASPAPTPSAAMPDSQPTLVQHLTRRYANATGTAPAVVALGVVKGPETGDDPLAFDATDLAMAAQLDTSPTLTWYWITCDNYRPTL